MPKTKPGAALHALLSCRTPEDVIAEAGAHLKNPVILVDLSLHILAITEDGRITDPRWRELTAGRMMPMDLVNRSLYRDALRSGAPVITTDSTGLPIVRCAVARDEGVIAYLLSPCYHGSPTQEELDILQAAADCCSLRIRRLRPGDASAARAEDFIAELFSDAITDEQLIRDRCRALGWHLAPPYRVLTVRSADPDEMLRGEGYLAQTRRCELLKGRFPDATVFLYGEQVKLLISTGDDPIRERLILQELADCMRGHGLVAGLSQPGRTLSSLSARHRQAMQAMRLGTLLLGAGPVYSYDRYAVYHALEICAERLDLRDLCHGAVLTLERYDRRHGTAYMGTLHAYLASGKNARDAAEALYIHRNTLAKRLEKIADLITVDLDDRETVFHLLFSLRVIEYYGATKMRPTFERWVERMPTLRHE